MSTYQNYTNVSSRFARGYEANDTVVPGWSGTVEVESDLVPGVALEALFARHNRDDRPDGQMCPSMSVGDVVVLNPGSVNEAAFTVQTFGFARITLAEWDQADVDRRPWATVMDEARRAAR